MHRATLLSILCIFFLSFAADAQVDPAVQKAKEEVKTILNASYEQDKKTSRQLWEYAEVGFKESINEILSNILLKLINGLLINS